MSQRIFKFFSSLRLTLVLIGCLSLIFLLGLWVPQKALLKKELYLQWKSASPTIVSFLETLGLTDIYTSPVTIALWFLFFLNLLFVMWQRVPLIRSKIAFSERKLEDPLTSPIYPHRLTVPVSTDHYEKNIQSALAQEGYRLYGTPQRFYAVKNRLSPAATLLFHMSFFLILLGGIIDMYTRFSATVDLAEGEVFGGDIGQYNPVPRLPKLGSLPDSRFVIDKIMPIIEGETPTFLMVKLIDSDGRRHMVAVNKPYKTDHTSFVIKTMGVAPLVILEDAGGRELDGAFVKLDVMGGKQDSFALSEIDFTAEYFPDYFIEDGEEGTRSLMPNDPAFRFHIQKGRKFLARKTVRVGGFADFETYHLRIPEMRFWVRFYVVKEYGVGLVYSGFGIAAIALVYRLLFYRREVIGAVTDGQDGAVLHIAGRAEFYKALFTDELERLAQRIAGSEYR